MIGRLRTVFHRLRRDATALAATEFAMTFPILLSLGLTGMELINRTIVSTRVNQLAVQVADNASRIGDQSVLVNKRITENDIQDLFYGAEVQAGNAIDIYRQGRVIVSSQEVVPGTTGNQYIHWQRCMGAKRSISTYGLEGDGTQSAFPGMGPPGEEVLAFEGEAVIFVEVFYDYKPLIGNPFGWDTTIHTTSSFTVRDSRDLTQIYQADASNPVVVASCDAYRRTAYSS